MTKLQSNLRRVVVRTYSEGNERQLCVGDCIHSCSQKEYVSPGKVSCGVP